MYGKSGMQCIIFIPLFLKLRVLICNKYFKCYGVEGMISSTLK